MNWSEVVENLKCDLIDLYADKKEISKGISPNAKRWELIRKIERKTYEILESIANGDYPVLETVCKLNEKHCDYNERLIMNHKKIKKRKINFKNKKGRLKFAILIFLLSKIHKLLTTAQTCTRRELYYKNLEIFQSQKQVDDAMRDVSFILKASPWDLGVFATSKGLVSGPLILHLRNGESVDCGVKGGVSIPSNMTDVTSLSSSAHFVLIIEKDTVFHRLMDEEAGSRLGSCIFITGKGYPDVSTRMLVCKFWEVLKVPIFALSDADPYGFDIMCVYRFGSVSMSSLSDDLACAAIRWLGIHPSDIKPLLLNTKSLSDRDIRKIQFMMERTYVKKNDNFKSQLDVLLRGNVKAEIESLTNISSYYLIDVYIKSKILCKEYY